MYSADQSDDHKSEPKIVIKTGSARQSYEVHQESKMKQQATSQSLPQGSIQKKRQRIQFWTKILEHINNGNHQQALKISRKLCQKSKIILEQYKSDAPLSLKNLYYVICDCLMHVKCKLLCDEIENVWQLLILAKDLLIHHFKFEKHKISRSIIDIKNKKKEILKNRGENQQAAQEAEEELWDKYFGGIEPTFYDFQWVLSALSIIAAFFNEIGYYGLDSLQAANVYFLLGLYYIEQALYGKANQCFKRAQLNRQKKLSPNDPNVADCRYNIAIVFKKRGILDKGIEQMNKALDARRGKNALSAAKALEQLGKMHLERGDYTAAYQKLQECYDIRKKMIRDTNHPELKRVCYLIMFLHRLIEKQVKSQSKSPSIVLQKNYRLSKILSAKMQSNQSGIKFQPNSIESKNKNKIKSDTQVNQFSSHMFIDAINDQERDMTASSNLKKLFTNDSLRGDNIVGSSQFNQYQERKYQNDDDQQRQRYYPQNDSRAPPQSYQNTGSLLNFQDEEYAGGGGGGSQIGQITDQLGNFLKIINNGPDDFILENEQKRLEEQEQQEDQKNQQDYNEKYAYLIAFIQLLNKQQIEVLNKQNERRLVYFSYEFLNSLNQFQLNLLNKSKIMSKLTQNYLINPKIGISLKNLKINSNFGLSKRQQEVMLGMFNARSEIQSALNQYQKGIFLSCIQNNISIWTLICCLSQRQKQLFRTSLIRYQTELGQNTKSPLINQLSRAILQTPQLDTPKHEKEQQQNVKESKQTLYKSVFKQIFWDVVQENFNILKQRLNLILPSEVMTSMSKDQLKKLSETKKQMKQGGSMTAQDLSILLFDLLDLLSSRQIYSLLLKNLFLLEKIQPEYATLFQSGFEVANHYQREKSQGSVQAYNRINKSQEEQGSASFVRGLTNEIQNINLDNNQDFSQQNFNEDQQEDNEDDSEEGSDDGEDDDDDDDEGVYQYDSFQNPNDIVGNESLLQKLGVSQSEAKLIAEQPDVLKNFIMVNKGE